MVQLLDRPAVKFSDLQREPRQVSQEVDRGPVRVTRRDGAPLVLMREDTLQTTMDGMRLVSQVLGLWMAGDPREIDQNLGVLFPWVAYLSRAERSDCARELLDTARACTATEEYLPLLACAKAWQSTAEAYAAGWDKEPVEWFDEPVSVSRPTIAE